MVNSCANPKCGKPLHYLREGRIFLFQTLQANGERRLEHFWLCGTCSTTMLLEQTNDKQVRLVERGLATSRRRESVLLDIAS